jgi:hypothetical protein
MVGPWIAMAVALFVGVFLYALTGDGFRSDKPRCPRCGHRI